MNINLYLDEQNYIQLCRKANSFINDKNEIEKEIVIKLMTDIAVLISRHFLVIHLLLKELNLIFL